MSDMNQMPRGMGGTPPMGGMSGGGKPPGDAIKQNMSIFNPADALMMNKSGQVSEDQTIREGFQGMGLDVDKNTMADLRKFVGEQVQKANPLNKMKNMARPGVPPGTPGPGTPPPPGPEGAPETGGQTLDDLMKG